MDDRNAEELLQQGLTGDSPGEVFRARVLLDSTAALTHRRWFARPWNMATLSAAAALIATVSFLLGRCSIQPVSPWPMVGPIVTSGTETIAVPAEAIAWLDAARLFKQLGMEDRMNRALDYADRLLPREAIAADSAAGPRFATGGEPVDSRNGLADPNSKPGLSESLESANRILAEFLGGCYHANGTN